MSWLYVALLVLFVVVIGLGIGLWALARQVGILFERVAPLGALVSDSGPAVGASSPVMQLESLNGGVPVSIGGTSTKATLLFFLSPTCPVCKKLLPILASINKSEKNWLQIVLASDGDDVVHKEFIRERHLEDYPYVLSTDLGMTFRVSRLPFAVLIGEDGTVQSKGLVNNREQVESLFNAREMKVSSIQKYIDQVNNAV